MIDANSQFFAILTNVGMAKQANADALGIPWKITEMGVGDANLTNPIPNATQTSLINEWRRRPLNQLKVDAADPAIIIAEQIIPADEGGRWIREIGLYDADGELVAVANCAPSYKPLLSQGSGRTQVVRMNFIVNNSGNITLKIDPAVVLASRSYVDAAILEVLPANKTAGEFTRVKVNNRGVVVSGDNPSTLAAMGITDTYTKPQIEAMIAQASALPVGTMVAFPVNKVAPGFLEIDGSVKSIAAYPDLAAFLGTAFNLGNEGAGNFRLPESRAEFLRGWDHGRGVDAGRALGSSQLDALQNITGAYTANNGVQLASSSQPPIGAFDGTYAGGTQLPAGAASTGIVNMSFDASRVARTSTETRGRNLAVMWCLKAWNAPINQGNIDVAALVALAAQATEINQGTAKVATQAQVNAGTDDATIVTPKKLRWGFAMLLAINGFIAFPSWLGGFVFQWGRITINQQPTINSAATGNWMYPMQFPTACLSVWAFQHTMGGNTSGSILERLCGNGEPAINGATFVISDADTVGNYTIRTFAIGS
jgi:phage-related tail fiber protein